jgi:hypothetical protein
MIMQQWPESTAADVKDKFGKQFSATFTQSDIDTERNKLRELLGK